MNSDYDNDYEHDNDQDNQPKAASNKPQAGVVYLVGSGPGDPRLVTVRGLECIRRADVILYDSLANTMLLDYARPDCEKIHVGGRAAQDRLTQSEVNDLIIQKARECETVVRLKGGDPFVFGRGGEEAEALANAGVMFKIVPGVTAGLAALAYAGIPATHRGVSTTATLITGHRKELTDEEVAPWAQLARQGGTLIFYMAVRALPMIVERLLANGLAPETPAVIVEWGTHFHQRAVTADLARLVETAETAEVQMPSIIAIGEVTRMRERMNWFESSPLFGRRILITRSQAQTSRLTEPLEALGAEVIEFPTIRIDPLEDPAPLREAARRSGEYDWVIFTSTNAVDHFMTAVDELDLDVRVLGSARLAAVGAATEAALKDHGLRTDLAPKKFNTPGLLAAFGKYGDLKGQSILIPRSSISPDTLPDGLRAAGAQVDCVDAYRTVIHRPPNFPSVVEDLDAGKIDAVTFSSSSTVDNFIELIGVERFRALKCCWTSIGPVTSKTLRDHGVEPTIEAGVSTIPGLIEALRDHFAPQK